jgi:GAF domain-containing protein
MSGRDVLEALHSRTIQIPVILLIPSGFEQLAVPLMRKGVRDFLVKPFTAKELLESMQRAQSEVQLRRGETDQADQLARTRKRLRQALIEQRVCHEISRSVTTPMPLYTLLGWIVDAALFVTASEECVLMLKDPQTGRIRQHFKRCPQRVERPLPSRAVPDRDQPGAVVAMLHTPLKVGRRVMGVLAVKNRSAPRSFNDHERQMLQILADYAAIAIEYVRLVRQAEQIGDSGSGAAHH